MKSKEGIIKILKGIKGELKRYRVKKIELFGSVTRSEQSKTSDIDILADFEEHADLFDLSGLALFLEEKLKQKVDVVSRRALR
ncbi:MAG: nucleotidyltransferase domain-containing protein, partial [candidate division Zixibacteria bacterium]|nr:nucleotidyltransferase domain-containing protein [candidate division Zixibacteria bacterium]